MFRFRSEVTAETVRALWGVRSKAPPLTLEQLLTIQFAKCINYFRNDLVAEWGGQENGDERSIEEAVHYGYRRFCKDLQRRGRSGFGSVPVWLHKVSESQPWGPHNFCLRSEPRAEFGHPCEAYLSYNGGLLTLQQAAGILSVDAIDLLRIKCRVLLDEQVIDEVILQNWKSIYATHSA